MGTIEIESSIRVTRFMPREVKDAAGNVAIVVFDNGEVREQSKYGRVVLKVRGSAVYNGTNEIARIDGKRVVDKNGRQIANLQGSSLYRHPNGSAIAHKIEQPIDAAAIAAYLLLI